MALTAQDLGCCCGGVTFCGCTGLPNTLSGTHTILGSFAFSKLPSSYASSTVTYDFDCTGSPCYGSGVHIFVILTCTLTCIANLWNLGMTMDEANACAGRFCPSDASHGHTANGVAVRTGPNTAPTACSPFSLTYSLGSEGATCAGTNWGILTQGVASTFTITP